MATVNLRMRVNQLRVLPGNQVKLENDAIPDPNWVGGEEIRLVTIEDASQDEIAKFLNDLGCGSYGIAEHIGGERSFDTKYRNEYYIRILPVPSIWDPKYAVFHFVYLPGVMIMIFNEIIEQMPLWIETWWLKSRGPERSVEEVILFLAVCLSEEEETEYNRVRVGAAKYFLKLKEGQIKNSEEVEQLQERTYRLIFFFFEMQLFMEGLEFTRTHTLMVGHNDHYRNAISALKGFKESIMQVQIRLKELQDALLQDQQEKTEKRLRVLTIISAIFLPLTLMTGIYGMNFTNMPELQDPWGYYVTLGVMAFTGLSLTWYFYRKGWFG